ncbi:hydrophobe/amphiphile efflux-1 (HAE1) family protein [endosymbiont of Acanthamoeba sp. UWC8]|uniref:efflux RND transporter permease subunit n=1 Tax=endosymbiont of Acanthamoeba sp. UWC8 TaxID=86106 RepID=UPI0004D16DF3|nr:multidrug efflux RND transporter permease subunit [endosymbiont of Acanthamoeba sp. UWC8]AIF81127.1 hydrophobe/amphiphile efflux-1 (HAE1) family protein [endosymbiont of Acanthamoeba sp. UWC8]
MISRFFIDKPIFASVLSIIIVLAGIISMRALPIAQYPDIIPPEVVVSANYPGASAEVVASTIAAPLEDQINGVDGMLYMRSSSSNSGKLGLTVTFQIGTDPDQATINVNNRVQAALARLPAEVRQQGVTVNKRSSSILQVITLFSPNNRYDPIYLSNYALLNIIDELKRTPGVGDASLFGAKDYSMRIWLHPDKLAQYNLSPSDVAAAIAEQNSQFAPGQFGQEPNGSPQAFTYTITTQGRFSDIKQFEDIILQADSKGATLRLKDVARVELGALDYSFAATYNGNPSVAIGIYLQPGANALATTEAVAKTLEKLNKNFPEGVAYALPFDTTKFVSSSIKEVITTFLEAILLVVIVVYIFLQNARATIIPIIAIPISLIGTFAGMYLLGFSINLLTLFGMVLAIGIVVDDAIVVLENVERIMRTQGLNSHDASIKAMEEVSGPVIAIVLVLCAVFIPVGFMGGLTGEMYKQFAITIAVSVTISGFVALTLTPALCVLMLKNDHQEPFKIFEKFNKWFESVTDKYSAGVRYIILRAARGIAIFGVLILFSALMFARTPTALVPEEDQGYILAMPFLLPGASLSRTTAVTDEVTKRMMSHPAVKSIVTFAGFDLLSASSKSSAGASFVALKDWEERKDPAHDSRALTRTFMGMGADIKEAVFMAFNPPPITGISMTGGFEFYLQNKSGADIQTIAATANKLVVEASKRPELSGMQTTISVNIPQYSIIVDRVKAKALGVSINTLFSTMTSTFGSSYINDFNLYGKPYKVILQSDADFRSSPENLKHVFVKSSSGKMIPLDVLVQVKRTVGTDLVERFNAFPAAKIMGAPAAGFSSGQALAAIEEVVQESLPSDYTIGWTGSAYQEKAASGSSSSAFGFGIVMVFLILAALYERWSLPFAVIMAVPFAIFGALLAVVLRNLNIDLYFQVGLLTLIGLAAKNAILIIEFAVMLHKEGKSVTEAAIEAAHLRFRPIIMTSLAFILGCMPLALSSGAGSASRHSIGTGIIGGMLAATFIAVFFIPLFFKLALKLGDYCSGLFHGRK